MASYRSHSRHGKREHEPAAPAAGPAECTWAPPSSRTRGIRPPGSARPEERLKKAKVNPAKIHAVRRTGRIITRDNWRLLSPQDRAAWQAALEEYKALWKQRNRSSRLKYSAAQGRP